MKSVRFCDSVLFRIISFAAMLTAQCAIFISVTNRRCGANLLQMILLVIAYDAVALLTDTLAKRRGNPLLLCIPGVIIAFGATTQAVINPLFGVYEGLTEYAKMMFAGLFVLFLTFLLARKILSAACSKILYNLFFWSTVIIVWGACALRLAGGGNFYALYVLSIIPYILTVSVILNSTRASQLFIFSKAKMFSSLDDSEYKLIISMAFSVLCYLPLIIVGELGTFLVEVSIYLVMMTVYSGDIKDAYKRIRSDKGKNRILIGLLLIFALASVAVVVVAWGDFRSKFGRVTGMFAPLIEGQLTQQQTSRLNIFNGGAFGLSDLVNMKRTPVGGSDMVFASLCQVWGYAGGFAVIALFGAWAVIALRMTRISIKDEPYNSISRLACVGSVVSILVHTLVNVGSATGAFPVCGISLPLISKGGSSMIPVFVGMGLVWHRSYFCAAGEWYAGSLEEDRKTKKAIMSEKKEALVSFFRRVGDKFSMKNIKKTAKIVGCVLGSVILLCGIVILAAGIIFSNIIGAVGNIEVQGLGNTKAVSAVADMEIVSHEDIINILILGTDKAQGDKSRSDAMLILSVNTQSGAIKTVSLARDCYVEIPDREGRYKLTAAYSFGGAELAARTVEANFRIALDGVCTFSFDSAADIVDIIGGVDIELSEKEAQEIAKHVSGEIEIKDGVQHLNGAQAVYYARIRKIDDNFGREERQEKLISAVIGRLSDMGIANLILEADDIAKCVNTSFTKSELKELFFKAVDVLKTAYNTGEIKIEKDFSIPVEKHAANRFVGGESVLDLYVPYNAEELTEYLYADTEVQL